jgi:hypothetical protein
MLDDAFVGMPPGWIPPELEQEEPPPPELTPGTERYWNAFCILAEARPVAVGMDAFPLPIPLSEFAAFFSIRGIDDPDEREDYLYFVRACDREWLSLGAKERAKRKK